MKHLFTLILILLTNMAFAQFFGAKKVEGPVVISGYTLNEGDTITLGGGSTNMGNFKYIYMPFNGQELTKNWSGRKVIVKGFRKETNKQFGEKIRVLISLSAMQYNYNIELEPAIKSGEIVAINSKPINEQTKPITSVADELIKLKQLMDSGAITQEEYDKQKKKLLNN